MLILFGSCKKSVFDINTNPNSPTEDVMTPELLLPRILHRTAARMATGYGDYGGWMGYWARSGTYGPSTEPESYNITNTFQAGDWSTWYQILMDVNTMEVKANEGGQTFYEGIAKVIKAIGFMYLVDQYNNVPYSKAFDLASNILPSYDKGDSIYANLIEQLNDAAALLKEAKIVDNPGIEDADIVFGGDIQKWIALANTQCLKLLIHESEYISEGDAKSEVAKIVANGAGFLNSGESANVQPGYLADDGKQNPFWNTYKTLYTGSSANQYWRANNYVLDLYRNNDDVRYKYFFSKAQTPVDGNDYYGYNYGEVVIDPDQPKAANSSDVSGPGLAKSATQAQWLFTSVESEFLQAEAIQRNWLSGDAKTAYENAVKESFIWLGVTDAVATAEDYLSSGKAIVDWTKASNKIDLIVTQKYLALTGINNFEAWVDYRRLGIPNVPLSLSPSRGSNKIPLRLLYPQNEYNYNPANVKKEGTIDAQTSKIFWDK